MYEATPMSTASLAVSGPAGVPAVGAAAAAGSAWGAVFCAPACRQIAKPAPNDMTMTIPSTARFIGLLLRTLRSPDSTAQPQPGDPVHYRGVGPRRIRSGCGYGAGAVGI